MQKLKETTVDVKKAATVAAEYLRSLLGEIGVLRLEEVEQKKNDFGWLVTLSFVPPSGTRIYRFSANGNTSKLRLILPVSLLP